MNWLGYGAPAWLAGLAALALPVAIHLLSRGRQRRVAVGSTRWLAPAETLRARRVRPSRWWLLALRCLLIAALVLALADARLGVGATSDAARWLLVAPEVAAARARLEADNAEAYQALDAARTAGVEMRWLTPGMPAGDVAKPPPVVGAGLWSLLHEADALAPPGTAFVVLAAERGSVLSGERAEIDRAIEWHSVTDREENRWLHRAVTVGDDRLAVVVGASDDTSTRFERFEVDAESPRSSGLELTAETEGWRLALAEGGSVASDDSLVVPGLTETPEVAILFASERAEDVRYLRAGLEAVGAATSRRLTVREQRVEHGGIAAGDERLVFWLAETPVPAALLDRLATGGVLVSDALARFERCDSMLWLPWAALASRVDRCGPTDRGLGDGAEAALWSGADGRPLLVGERIRAGIWWRFASRWNPEWTDLVLAPQFPAWLLGLVEQAAPVPSAKSAESDRRSAPGQAAPRRVAAPVGEPSGRELALASWAWLLVFALAAGERWLASRSAA